MNKILLFLQLEATGGILLFLMACVAMLFVNSSGADLYYSLLHAPFFQQSLLFWVNDGLMAIFFLVVGLELKREFLEGELSGWSKIALPGAAALGGMVVPALLFILMNYQDGLNLKGWSIPVATDIAFAMGVLSFFSKRIPLSLKLFLLALAVFDDIGAIVIIAIFFAHGISLTYLLLAIAVLFLLHLLNRVFKPATLLPYLMLGIFLWVFILWSGLHPSIAGVLLALMIPLHVEGKETYSPLNDLEKKLHPWVVYLILPLFAFCNAGLSFAGLSWSILFQPLVLGIILGLWVGKQLGVLLLVKFMTYIRWADWPDSVSKIDMWGVALLCGIGFTMSLFLGTLAFQGEEPQYLTEVRLGVFLGSVLSALSGSLVLHMAYLKKRKGGSA